MSRVPLLRARMLRGHLLCALILCGHTTLYCSSPCCLNTTLHASSLPRLLDGTVMPPDQLGAGATGCNVGARVHACTRLTATRMRVVLAGKLRRKTHNQRNIFDRLRSVAYDAQFVAEISQLYPRLPLVANLRCGLWYHPTFEHTCYFKSTDGHANEWQLSLRRLNLHLLPTISAKGGVVIVDATRRGRRLPDSFKKTIPIWAACVNRAIERHRRGSDPNPGPNPHPTQPPHPTANPGAHASVETTAHAALSTDHTTRTSMCAADTDQSNAASTTNTTTTTTTIGNFMSTSAPDCYHSAAPPWCTELHTAPSVSPSEKAQICSLLEGMVDALCASGAGTGQMYLSDISARFCVCTADGCV